MKRDSVTNVQVVNRLGWLWENAFTLWHSMKEVVFTLE